MLQQAVSYFTANGADWLALAIQHVSISGAALILATVIAAPAGALASRSRVAGIMASALAGVMRVVPSLAVLILCVPYLGGWPYPGHRGPHHARRSPHPHQHGNRPSGRTRTGARSRPGHGHEPLAGVCPRTCSLGPALRLHGRAAAATEVIASATLASYIGAGGLGVLIHTGIGALRFDLLWIGGLSVAMLSLLVNRLLAHIGRRLRHHELAAATPSPASTEAAL